jgi:aminopeptidase N
MVKKILILFFLVFYGIVFSQNFFYSKKDFVDNGCLQCLDSVDIFYLKLDIKAQAESSFIDANAFVGLKIKAQELQKICLQLVDDYTVDSVLVNGEYSVFAHDSDVISISLNHFFYKDDFIDLHIFYKGQAQNVNGITASKNSFGKYVLWTLSEPFHAKEWFPCKESLSDKLDSVDVWITVPKNQKAGSNGVLTGLTQIDTGHVRYEWKHRHKIAYYLISIAVSDYLEYNVYANLDGDSVLIQNFIYNDSVYFRNQKINIDKTVDLLEFYSEIYGIYPFFDEKYGHCQAPFDGGMEHQTMCTIKDFNFRLNSHELAHQWFGNYVTCASWQDIWINEGFAAYTEYLASQRFEAVDEAQAVIRFKQNDAMSQPGGSVYIPAIELVDEARIFSGRLSYSKGASIIHQIRYIINNDTVFFNVLKTFLNTYKDSIATGDDFKVILERVSGLDFENYFQQWYYGEGYPVYAVEWESTNSKFYCNLEQTTSTNTITFFDIPVEFKLYFNDGRDTIFRYYPESNYETFALNVKDSVVKVDIDPSGWVMKDVKHIINMSKVPDAKIKIYPNPFTDYVNLDTKIKLDYIRITDISGKTVFLSKKTNAKTKLYLENFKKSLYFIILYDINGNNYTYKLIKQ